MYAVINSHGSRNFRLYGPASRDECEQWLQKTVRSAQRTELATRLLPQRILPDRLVESWKFRDGTPVTQHALGREALTDCDVCGFPEQYGHDYACPHA